MRWPRWLARQSALDADMPERLIDMPSFREPSPELLQRLRALDPRAEVVYVGEGRWWVGRVKPNAPRRITGRKMAAALKDSRDGISEEEYWPLLRQALLMAQGFGVVVDVTIHGEPDARLVHEFAIALFVERGGQYLSPEEQAVQSAQRDRARERRTRERDLTRWLYRRSPSGRANAWVSLHTGRRSA